LHAFMPFVTEEIYHQLKERKEGDDLTIARTKEVRSQQSEVLTQGELLKETITAIRDARNKNQLKPKERIKLFVQSERNSVYKKIESILQKQLNLETVSYTDTSVPNTINVVIDKDKFFIGTENQTDSSNHREQLQKDLLYFEGFLASVEKKL